MARTTYLLGAGASADALPLVNDFEAKINTVIGELGNSNIDAHERNKEPRKIAIIDLKMLMAGCIQHRSVDTFAKKLFLTSDKLSYRRLKCAIILFFELYTAIYGKTDKRYDALLATILNKREPRLPDDINILSWNYDYEFEKAYLNYTDLNTKINKVYQELNIVHKNHKAAPSIKSKFGIIKINGTAGFYTSNNGIILGVNHNTIGHIPKFVGNSFEPFAKNLLSICDSYFTYAGNDDFEPAISFSWEDEYKDLKIESEIERALSDTEKLIIIGYSFPYFNRAVDKYIFNKLPTKKVDIIIQDIQGDELLDAVVEIRQCNDYKYKIVRNCSQFYMTF